MTFGRNIFKSKSIFFKKLYNRVVERKLVEIYVLEAINDAWTRTTPWSLSFDVRAYSGPVEVGLWAACPPVWARYHLVEAIFLSGFRLSWLSQFADDEFSRYLYLAIKL